jgi:hypothetical protein
MSDNVVRFPKAHKFAPPQTIEEVKENISLVRTELADHAIAEGMMALFEALAKEGVDITGDDVHMCNALICESIRAATYKALTLYHPFHTMVEHMIVFEHTEDGFSYTYKLPTHFETEEEDNS